MSVGTAPSLITGSRPPIRTARSLTEFAIASKPPHHEPTKRRRAFRGLLKNLRHASGRELSASVDASGQLLRRNGEHRKGARAHAFGIHRPRHAIVARGATPGLRVSSGNGQVYAADHVPFMRCSWRCISERVCLCFGSAARLYSSCGSAASSYSSVPRLPSSHSV